MARVVEEKYETTLRYSSASNRYTEVSGWKQSLSYPQPVISARTMSDGDVEIVSRTAKFAVIVVAWSIAKLFGCSKFGKMRYSQLAAKYKR